MFVWLIISYSGYVFMVSYILQWLCIWWIITYSGYVFMISYILQCLCLYDEL